MSALAAVGPVPCKSPLMIAATCIPVIGIIPSAIATIFHTKYLIQLELQCLQGPHSENIKARKVEVYQVLGKYVAANSVSFALTGAILASIVAFGVLGGPFGIAALVIAGILGVQALGGFGFAAVLYFKAQAIVTMLDQLGQSARSDWPREADGRITL